MNWKGSLDTLEQLQVCKDLRHEQTLTSAVTTGWGVNWSEEYIARDIMQNFFDANRDCLSKVRVDVHGSDVTISAPTSYNLEHLFYFHSTKGQDDIGQYGEGFKAAAMCLLRDHHIEPIAVSGRRVLYIRISDETVGNIRLKPVIYDFFSGSQVFEGTRLILRGCSRKLIDAFRGGMDHFLHGENPLLLEGSYGRLQIVIDLQEELKANHVQHMVHTRLRIEQIEMFLKASFPIPVDGSKGTPTRFWIRWLLASQQGSRALQGHQARTAHIGSLAQIEQNVLPSATHNLLGCRD